MKGRIYDPAFFEKKNKNFDILFNVSPYPIVLFMKGGVDKAPMTKNRMTDREITEIYLRHVQTVYRVCYLYVKNPHDTEDMVQNTFIRLMRDDSVTFESNEHEKAWLIRTAVNLCKDFFKSRKRISLNYDSLQESAHYDQYRFNEALEKVLELPPKYKTAIYMYYYEGYTSSEIAKILGMKESTVRSRLHHGRKRLKMEMEAEEL
jgi:RNA polymerase sigma factor (sigma-70 family)